VDHEGWGHILREHPELALYRKEIMAAHDSPVS